MAETLAGAALTRAHAQRQLALRSAALRTMLGIWPAFDLDDIDDTWRTVEPALLSLTTSYRRQSAALASGYYRAFRLAEGVPGIAQPVLGPSLDTRLYVATLRLLGPIAAKKNISAGLTDAAGRTLTRVSGSIDRNVLNGGRDTLAASVKADKRAKGYQRVTSGSGCDFCEMLAGRGPVYSEQSSDFEAHDHCGCSAEPVFA